MALVYEARNRINGKRYIGVTTTGLARRSYMHLWAATSRTARAKSSVFGRAIRKHGRVAFDFTVIEDGLTIEDALKLERILIQEQKPEYNVSAGGIGPSGVKWTKARHRHMAVALRLAWTDERRAKMSEWRKRCNYTISPETRARMAQARLASKSGFRPVTCLDDGKWFENIKAAAEHYNISHRSVCGACQGKGQVRAGGLFFSYAAAPLSERKRKSIIKKRLQRLKAKGQKIRIIKSRPVVCVTDGCAFPSGRAAADFYNLHQMTVVACCRDGAVTKSGLRFRYADSPARDKHKKTRAQLADIRRRRTVGLAKSWAQTQKKVVCLDDGRTYPSITDAAAAYGSTVALVSTAIYRSGKTKGHRFAFAGEA